MTFDSAASGLARRFLTDRTFELIVHPALADLEYDLQTGGSPTRARLAVLLALAGGTWDDAIRGAGVWTFCALVGMPACYYCALFALLSPGGVRAGLTPSTLITLGVSLLVLGLVPALACVWPDAASPTPSASAATTDAAQAGSRPAGER